MEQPAAGGRSFFAWDAGCSNEYGAYGAVQFKSATQRNICLKYLDFIKIRFLA